MRREAARAAARAASLASSRVCHPATTTPRGGFASSSSSFAKSKTKGAPRKARDPPPGTTSTSSIAGDATREYLVKLPAQEMAAGLDEAQSSMRTRLITLTSVGAAVYLGYYIFPLVGGGTASSATQMLRSKDVLFQRTGVSRLMTVLAAPGGVQLVAAAVENNGAADALVRIVSNASVPTAPKKWWFTRRRVPRVPSQQGADPGADTAVVSRREARVACAGVAASALRKMAAEPAIATAMRSRGSGLAASLLAASRDEGLDRNVRDTMGEAHALLVAGEGK